MKDIPLNGGETGSVFIIRPSFGWGYFFAWRRLEFTSYPVIYHGDHDFTERENRLQYP